MHFFDSAWSPQSTDYTYGHDIEASWLLSEAAQVLGDTSLQDRVNPLALTLARSVLAEGIDPGGGLCYGGDRQRVTRAHKEWWPQAECVVGFLNAYRLSGNAAYAVAARAVWDFIQKTLVDTEGGEWYWRVDPQGRPDPKQPKVSTWKGPYHNVRACLEILKRLQVHNGESLESSNRL